METEGQTETEHRNNKTNRQSDCRVHDHGNAHARRGGTSAACGSNGSAEQVWVNLRTDIYHMPYTRWHGQTKLGLKISLTQAENDGFRRAANGQ